MITPNRIGGYSPKNAKISEKGREHSQKIEEISQSHILWGIFSIHVVIFRKIGKIYDKFREICVKK